LNPKSCVVQNKIDGKQLSRFYRRTSLCDTFAIHVASFFKKTFTPSFSILSERHAVTLNWYGFQDVSDKTSIFVFGLKKGVLFFF